MSIELEYIYLDKQQLADSPHLEAIFNLVNESFALHHVGHFDQSVKLVRFGDPSELVEVLQNPASFICVGLHNNVPVTTVVIKPFDCADDKRVPPPEHTVLGHTAVSKLTPMEENYEVAIVTVKYRPEYLKRGLSSKSVSAALTKLSPPVGLWIVTTDVNTEYWQRQGYTITDEYQIAKGGWNFTRDFKLHFLQKLLGH